MSVKILARRGAIFGTLAAGMFLLAVVIAALLHLKEPLAPQLLIGMAVAGIALAYGAFAYFIFTTKADRELVSSAFARRSAS